MAGLVNPAIFASRGLSPDRTQLILLLFVVCQGTDHGNKAIFSEYNLKPWVLGYSPASGPK